GAGAAAEPEAPITATMLFTATVSPSLTRISETTPAGGDGISASTLSVEISKSGSSRSTLSPTFLIQRTIVPSAIDSPICGITTSVAITPRRSTSHQITRDGALAPPPEPHPHRAPALKTAPCQCHPHLTHRSPASTSVRR